MTPKERATQLLLECNGNLNVAINSAKEFKKLYAGALKDMSQKASIDRITELINYYGQVIFILKCKIDE